MKNFSKVLLMTIFGSLIYSSSAKADWDYYGIQNINTGGFKVFTCVSSTSTCTEKGTQSVNAWSAGTSYVNPEIIIPEPNYDNLSSQFFIIKFNNF